MRVEMADSKENIENQSSDDFGDDLDEMLKDAESEINDQEDLIDDEDAIDRLLMDDSTYSEAEGSSVEDDAFSEDESDEFDVDQLISSSVEDSKTDGDESVEQGVAGAVTDEIEKDDTVKGALESASSDEIEDDFLMVDFDISSDDGDESSGSEATEEVDDFGEESDSPIVENDHAEKIIETPVVVPVATTELAPPSIDNSAIDAINNQLAEIISENAGFKEQIAELLTLSAQEDPNTEEIEILQKEQRKLKKAIKESESKIPIVTYIALGIAIVALLVGGGLGVIGYGAQSSVTELSELVMTLEEEIEVLSAKDTTVDIKKLGGQIKQLTLSDKDINEQLALMSKNMQSNPLKPVVDDLVVQNNHAQEAIETLLAKVETLERRKPVVVAKAKKAKKAKKIIAKVTWMVNLVSFKQEWYAKRKSAEFRKKGIPAQVTRVKVKGENWFRLSVKGFKSKYEAAAYAVKVKKSLNLSSVWVTKA